MIQEKNIENIIEENMMDYARELIKNRVLPALEDGLKPSYRNILIIMDDIKATKLTKSQNVEGQVMRIHPHAGVYPTMVGMVQKDNNLTPLLEGKGNFGQYTSEKLTPSAPRYTEVKLSDFSKDIFKGLNKSVVEWTKSFDGTMDIPKVLPVKFPLILNIAQEGMAVGLSSKFPSFNLNEICDAIITYLKTGYQKNLLIPDFATGGSLVKDKNILYNINTKGKGTLKLRAKTRIEGDNIIIFEVPYGINREKIIDEIIKLVKEKKITEIKNVIDITGLKQMGIKIVCKRNCNKEILLEKLYKLTSMEANYSCNMNLLFNGKPETMGVWEIIKNWLDWRNNCLINEKKEFIKKLKYDIGIIEGLEVILCDIEQVINIVRNTKRNLVVEELIKRFPLDKEQAEYIFKMPLYSLNKDFIKEKLNQKLELNKSLTQANEFINNEDIRKTKIIQDLEETKKKFGQPRRTEIINEVDKKEVIDLIKEEKDNSKVYVFITKEGYIKKVKNPSGKHKLKAGDKIIKTFETNNQNEILVFAGTTAYKIYLEDLDYSKVSDLGDYIQNIIEVDENIIGYSIIDEKYKFNLIAFSDGRIAKVDLNSFKTTTKRKKLINSICKDKEVIFIEPFTDDVEIILTNKKGKEKNINTKELMVKSKRDTQGVKVWKDLTNIKA